MELYEEDLNSILGSSGTTESLRGRLTEYMQQKKKELGETRNRLQGMKQNLSSNETRQKINT